MPISFKSKGEVEKKITPIFPASEESSQQHDVDFDVINCFPGKQFSSLCLCFVCIYMLLQQIFMLYTVGDVNVVDDVETKMTGIEVNGDDSYIEFPVQSPDQYVVLQLKNLDRFSKLVLRVYDSAGKSRTFIMSNRRTTVHLQNSVCQLPMEMGTGWQHLSIDLRAITAKCFGTDFIFLTNIMVYGSTRIGKIYFQDREYSDLELPHFLRLLPSL
jgi:hypothetical protein